jgi:hypothetical protein
MNERSFVKRGRAGARLRPRPATYSRLVLLVFEATQ